MAIFELYRCSGAAASSAAVRTIDYRSGRGCLIFIRIFLFNYCEAKIYAWNETAIRTIPINPAILRKFSKSRQFKGSRKYTRRAAAGADISLSIIHRRANAAAAVVYVAQIKNKEAKRVMLSRERRGSAKLAADFARLSLSVLVCYNIQAKPRRRSRALFRGHCAAVLYRLADSKVLIGFAVYIYARARR